MKWPIVWVLIGILLAPIRLAGSAIAASSGPASEFDFVDYLAIDDLASAAANMRADAIRLGLDISAVPVWRNFSVFSDTTSGKISVSATGFVGTTIDIRDKSLVQRFAAAKASGVGDNELIVIMVTRRNLSIDEIASILEGRVRILNSFASNVFVLRGTEADLGGLVQRDYFGWFSGISPEMKRGLNWHESPFGTYDVFSFGPVTEEYARELESLGLTVTKIITRGNVLNIRGEWDKVRNLPALWWVRFVLVPSSGAPDDALGVEASP